MGLDLVSTLCDLVRLPSVNPMGRPVSGDIYFEHRVTDYLQELFQQLGVAWHRQTVQPQRDNIVARIDGDIPLSQGGALLMLEAHQDTVPVDGMTIPPWTPTISEGKVYGRGACDIKGGMAAMLWAFARLIEERPKGMPTVIMACSVNEEHGFYGARELAELWKSPSPSDLIPQIPDSVIVAEPTLLNVVVAHKGTVRWRCRTSGKAAHSSRPDQGDNAIYHMARVLGALESYAREETCKLTRHRLVGTPTLSVGVVSGGISVNTVPDDCYIEIDRRVVPGEDPYEARAKVMDYVAAHVPAGTPIRHEDPFIAGRGLADDANGQLAERLGAVAKAYGGGLPQGVPYGTNAPAYAAAGAPTVVFGPGSIDQAHTCDEWVEISQLQSAGEVLYDFARRFEKP
jgi:acetylornithine deacetylase/succinyl-diaminopimelate desuccinylase family protein